MLTDLTKAQAIVQERTGSSLPIDIDDRLEDSAGFSGSQKVYRAYFVAGQILWERVYAIESTPDATFASSLQVVEALMQTQKGIDKAQGLTVPEGMEAVPPSQRNGQKVYTSGVIEVNRT